jgi:hypothetical protein
MADYYPLVARAVAGLERNTGEARRALYERARTALVTQLRGVTPPLDESNITRERLALEEAIRKVETEAARRPRPAPAAPPPQQAAPPAPAPQPAAPPPQPPQAADQQPAPPQAPQAPVAPPRVAPPSAPPPVAPPPARAPMPQAQPLEPRPAPPSLRVPVPEEVSPRPRPDLDQAAAPPLAPQAPRRQPPQPPRDPLAGLPTAYDFDQHQPVLDPETLRPPQDYQQGYNEPPVHAEPPEELPPRRVPMALGPIVKVVISIAIVFALGALAWWQRDAIRGVYQAFRGSPATVARETPSATPSSAARPKISDRIGSSAQPQSGPVAPAVAQRVVLYEEEANDPQGKRYVGSVIWKTETVSPGAGKPPELAVRAEVEIPERRMNMTFSLRQNSDQTLPASHTVEIMFNLPADFAPGGINNVPGILMKQAEQTRGTPLAGLAVKVTSGFFLIGLSAVESDRQRNIELLKERAWFDIPIVYANNRRAILALEKGTPGERAFAEAFAAWKQ